MIAAKPNAAAATAVAYPALPPEGQTTFCLPCKAASVHSRPMPRILKEPPGCRFSSLSQMRRLAVLSPGCSTRGVLICSIKASRHDRMDGNPLAVPTENALYTSV
ncbi:hypothetical protein D3C75_1152680 [compost metagenome]